ncbi:MAG TPA: hypothetical protein VLG25_00345 [Patescibacteria group bacterium]|nr:hypothetical protein [Patescibacteria group bacterium]
MTFALVHSVHFLSEERTELYKEYCEGVPRLKNVLGAKNVLQSWALPSLERRDA